MTKYFVTILILMLSPTILFSKEVGDIMYHKSTPIIGFPPYSRMWGMDEASVIGIGLTANPTVCGHAMTFLGMDENTSKDTYLDRKYFVSISD